MAIWDMAQSSFLNCPVASDNLCINASVPMILNTFSYTVLGLPLLSMAWTQTQLRCLACKAFADSTCLLIYSCIYTSIQEVSNADFW